MNTLNNKVQLIGNLGQAPEVHIFENGNKKVSLNLAVHDSFINKAGEKIEETYWHKVIAYGKVVDTIEKYFDKGSRIMVEGKLVNRSWETKEGEKRYATEVVMNDFMFMDSKKDKAA